MEALALVLLVAEVDTGMDIGDQMASAGAKLVVVACSEYSLEDPLEGERAAA